MKKRTAGIIKTVIIGVICVGIVAMDFIII